MQKLYCWRCQIEIPMLDEGEWADFEPVLQANVASVEARRERIETSRTGAPIRQLHQPALDLYEKLTGFRETNPNALWHHRLSLYGPPCHHCGRPLRTPAARLCGACMAPREAV